MKEWIKSRCCRAFMHIHYHLYFFAPRSTKGVFDLKGSQKARGYYAKICPVIWPLRIPCFCIYCHKTDDLDNPIKEGVYGLCKRNGIFSDRSHSEYY